MSQPRWAYLRIVCPRDPDRVLAEFSTFDGKGSLMTDLPTHVYERIGFHPDVDYENHPAWATFPAGPAGGPHPEPHWLHTLECDRPTCNYSPQFTDEFTRALDALLFATWEAGQTEFVVDDLDELLRRHAEGAKGPDVSGEALN